MHYKRWTTHGDPLLGGREPMGTCAVDDCEDPAVTRGFCTRHYRRWLTRGDPLSIARIGRRAVEAERLALLWARIDRRGPDECWPWLGASHEDGYGRTSWYGRMRPAHRVVYELTVGPIPEGFDLDHLCRNPPCVNPAHLEPVTRRENLARGRGAEVTRARHAARRAARP